MAAGLFVGGKSSAGMFIRPTRLTDFLLCRTIDTYVPRDVVNNFLPVLKLEWNRNLTVFCKFLDFPEVKLVQLHSYLLMRVVSLLI